jgi:hypothetical protein
VGDALASSKRSGKSTGAFAGSSAAAYALRQRVMLIRLVDWPRRGKSGRNKSDEAVGVSFGAAFFLSRFACYQAFYFGIKPG